MIFAGHMISRSCDLRHGLALLTEYYQIMCGAGLVPWGRSLFIFW